MPSASYSSAAPPVRADAETEELNAAERYERDLLRNVDPFGGMYHPDYYRDPAMGYAPQYAPRNFAEGGRLEYSHPSSALPYSMSQSRRDASDHELEQLRQEFARRRATLRTSGEFDSYVKNHLSEYQLAGTQQSHESPHIGGKLAKHAVQPSLLTSVPTQQPTNAVAGGLSAADFDETLGNQVDSFHTRHTVELMNEVHGFRDQQRYEGERAQRMLRPPFRGYDLDRYLTVQEGRMPGQLSLQPLVSPSSMTEAQATLREDSVPTRTSLYGKILARNTVNSAPLVGEPLSEFATAAVDATFAEAHRQRERDNAEELGLGRQGSLVSESGPDRRSLKLHKNDERLLHAAQYAGGAYQTNLRNSADPENPYDRRCTSFGMADQLHSSFDIDRRQDALSSGKPDVSERNMIHYGTPVKQQVDTSVLWRRNARNERPMDYFTPFPEPKDFRLPYAYRDLEGFALFHPRPEIYEWELFVRYRAHHRQRRQLALLHGLEPVANETAGERDARRAALDVMCEQTPFDPSKTKIRLRELSPSAGQLRNWFGAYHLPSPTECNKVLGTSKPTGLAVAPSELEQGIADDREHLLSARYFNQLLINTAYGARLRRTTNTGLKVPEPFPEHEQHADILRSFTPEESAMHNTYLKKAVGDHVAKHELNFLKRRWVSKHSQFGTPLYGAAPVSPLVVDVQSVATGDLLTIGVAAFQNEIDAAASSPHGVIKVDNAEYRVLPATRRQIVVVSIRLDDGQQIEMEEGEWTMCQNEVQDVDPNTHLNFFGERTYPYNRYNYVETQDFIWEEQTAKGIEGWSPAVHEDIGDGTPVRARRSVGDGRTGGLQRAIVVSYQKQPFYNPTPRTVTVRFVNDDRIATVSLNDVMVWQVGNFGPDRTQPDDSVRNSVGVRRYVDLADPKDEKRLRPPHFLDKYCLPSTENPFRSVKQITMLDRWTSYDAERSENHRLLSIAHRKDFVRGHYFYRYTPWEYILHQEADQPMVKEDINRLGGSDGPSLFFNANRFWRYKRRPHGYITNYENEVRDLFQYVDGVTPWSKAKHIRSYWEVREHFPMPNWNRHTNAMHRNHPSLLPGNLWEQDKKSGKVKSLKDSVREYKVVDPYPKWVSL